MEKEIIILGDIEMGAGNLTDDFISDNTLTELILELAKRKHPLDLILNGDTFDFLKCPFISESKLIYPRHITNEISLAKLDLIYQAHKKVFLALKSYLKVKNKKLFFTIGNHDFDLVYPKVQSRIKELLNNQERIYFLEKYQAHGVYAEHGQQYDFLNKVNFNSFVLEYKNKFVLNLPFVSFGMISKMLHLKEEHPFIERIFPRNKIKELHSSVVKKMTLRTSEYFLKSIFYYPFRFYSDPTYIYPRELFKEFYRRVKQLHWEVDAIVNSFKRENKNLFYKSKICVLGHIHEKYIEDKNGMVIIHPGSWRDEYEVNMNTQKLIPRAKRYVQVLVEGNNLEYQLVQVPLNRSRFDYNQVFQDEIKYIQLAAEEEDYTPILITTSLQSASFK